MVYDPSTSRVLLFGGTSASGHRFADLWAYDPASNTWIELHPAGDTPGARSDHAMVYDSRDGKILLFGGDPNRMVYEDEQLSHDAYNDLWAYDPVLNSWTQLHPSGDAPYHRSGAGMVFDPAVNRVILFGGLQGRTTEFTPMDDLWSYDLATDAWTRLHPAGNVPSARSDMAMDYDPACCLTILFGGATMDSMESPDLPFPETLWAYDSAKNAWTKLEPAGRFPYGRMSAAMVYDASIGGMVMFGGVGKPSGYLSGTWALTP